jgi:predicted permease
MLNDIRYSLRALRKNLGFALISILSLALGIGANSAMFSLADALLLRPLPVPQPSQVVSVRSQTRGERPGEMSYRDYVDFRDRAKSFDGLAAYQIAPFGFAPDKTTLARMQAGMLVTGNFFRVLDVEPRLGRGFRPEEDQVPGRDAVAVLGSEMWRHEFGARPDAIGKTIFVNGVAFTVVGVAPESFTGMDQWFRPALFIPAAMAPRLAGKADVLEKRGDRSWTVKGRLKNGVTLAQANAEAAAIARGLAAAYPDSDRNVAALVRTEFQVRVDRSPYDAMIAGMLLGLAGVVLLIACANVANLLLSRARARSKEVAVRLAIGAGRLRLIRQLLTESLVVALLGGAAGLLLAQFAIDSISQFKIPGEIPIVLDTRLDWRVVGYAALASVVSAILFGLVPAMQTSKADLVPALKSGEVNGHRRRRLVGRNTLVIAQVAGSLLLLVCATQLFRGISFLLATPPGFRTNHLLMVTLDPALVRYTPQQTAEFYKRLVDETRRVPGVKSAALTRVLPMANGLDSLPVVPEGYQLPPGRESIAVSSDAVSDGYFETVGVEILEGRGFTTADTATSPRVAVVNADFARRYYKGQSAVGKRFRDGGPKGPLVEIVGVAKQSKYNSLLEPPFPFIYFPFAQKPETRMTLMAESYGTSESLLGPIREVVRRIDPQQPIYAARTMEEYFDQRGTQTLNLLTEITGSMGLLGLVLAMVGLYGLMAYSVSRRTREIGIRMAIGAGRFSVVRMVMRQGLLLSGIGIAIGLALSFALSRALTAGMAVPSFDLGILALVTVALLAMALLGAYVPARRASMIDPMLALRQE